MLLPLHTNSSDQRWQRWRSKFLAKKSTLCFKLDHDCWQPNKAVSGNEGQSRAESNLPLYNLVKKIIHAWWEKLNGGGFWLTERR